MGISSLFIVFFVEDACDCSFVEADTDLEADGLERAGDDVDGKLLHLVVVRTVLIVVACALVDEERDDDVGVGIGYSDLWATRDK